MVTSSASSRFAGFLVHQHRSLAGIASLSGDTVTLNGTGTVTITAVQNGNSNYNPSATVQQSFQVLPAIACLTWLCRQSLRLKPLLHQRMWLVYPGK